MLGDIHTYFILKLPLKFHLLIIPILQINKLSLRKAKNISESLSCFPGRTVWF